VNFRPSSQYCKVKLCTKNANDEEKSKIFEIAAKSSEMKEELIRIKYGKRAETEEVQDIIQEEIENDTRTKLEKLD
jgi:hypothetical protein